MDYKQIAQELSDYRVRSDLVEFQPFICQKATDAFKELLKERDAAISELKRIAEFCENDFLSYLNNTIHHECGYEYYSDLFDLLCQVTDWEYDDVWDVK